MAYYFLFPEKDATIYSHPDRTNMNTGHDEIIEVVKEKGSSDTRYYPSRILIKFKNEEVKSIISDTIGSSKFNDGTSKVALQLLSTEHKNLTKILNLEAYTVSKSWDEGSGRYSNLPTGSDGTTWVYRDNDVDANIWPTGSAVTTGLTFASQSITIGELPTGSAHELTINGVDFVPVVSSSLFDADTTEVYVDVTSSIDEFGKNLEVAINASQSVALVTASYDTSTNKLILSGSSAGSGSNVIVTTSSIGGIVQEVFQQTTGYSLQGGTDTTTSPFAAGTTGSINAVGISEGGGSWYTGSGFQATQQFLSADKLDTNFDVTDMVKKHSGSLFANDTYPDGVENEGFIIKQPDSVEENTSSSFGEMKYFSVDTHTIYPPRLIFKWDDSTHTYQSSAKNSGELSVSLYRDRKTYNQKDEAFFRVHVRDKYPTRQFASSSNFLNIGYLTTASYYSIRDSHTEEEVIPFDDTFTKLSADSSGMYFKVYMNGLQPERYYRVLFKHKNSEGTTIYDNDYHFKVIR